MPLLRFIFVLFWINLVHCGNRWVGGCGAAARHDGVTGLLCLHQFCSRNTGCVCASALRIQLTPRHCLGKREQEQSTVYSSLVRLCTALLSLSCAGSCGWYIPDNELGAGMEADFPPLFFLNTKSQIDQLPLLIKFYFHGWGWSTRLFHPMNVQRSCGMGVAWVIRGNKCLFSIKYYSMLNIILRLAL